MRARLFTAVGMATVLVAMQGCAPAGDADEDEPFDDAAAVQEAELRAGGIDNVVTQVPESELAAIVVRVERLEARGYPAPVVETFAVARVLEAARRASAASPSPPSTSGLGILGGYLWDHLKLNAQEGTLCKSKKVTCIKTLYVAHEAKRRSRALFADGENGGRRDAFRHAYWNARMVHVGGEAWAKAFADAHENGYAENQTTAKGRLLSAMDFFNNEVGRAHGARHAEDDALASALTTAIAEGDLRAVRFDVAKDAGELVGTDTCTPEAPCGL